MKNIKIVFFGTPEYVLPVLKKLHRSFNKSPQKNLFAVITQPPILDKKGLRRFSPVDDFAHKRKLEIYHDPQKAPKADLGILAAYGKIIPEEVISRYRYGILNIHPSLLPKFRGASPTQAAIACGEAQTGVSIIKMDSELDHGPIISSFKESIKLEDTNETLRYRLFERSADFLVELLPGYLDGKINLKPQNHKEATFTTTIKKAHGFLEPRLIKKALINEFTEEEKIDIPFVINTQLLATSQVIHNYIRALYPWPGVWTTVKINNEHKRLKILKSYVENNKLVLEEVQLEGKNPVQWQQFKEGYPDFEFSFKK